MIATCQPLNKTFFYFFITCSSLCRSNNCSPVRNLRGSSTGRTIVHPAGKKIGEANPRSLRTIM